MPRLFANTKAKIKQAVRELRDAKAIGVDTEASSLDPHTAKLWSVQFGNEHFQAMIPVNNSMFDIGEFQDMLLDDGIVKIMHRATYDLKILRRRGWDTNGVYCSRTMEQIISAGYYSDTSLAGCLRRYLGVNMSKTARKDFYCDVDGKEADANGTQTLFEFNNMEWTEELIDYAMGDVEHLVPLMRKQVEKLKDAGLLPLAQKIELPLVYVTSLIEERGVKLDRDKTMAFQREMTTHAEAAEITVVKEFDWHWQEYAMPIYKKNRIIWDEWKEVWEKVKKNNNSREGRKLSEEAKRNRQEHKLVQPFKVPPKAPVRINLKSPQQMRAALDHAGVTIPNMQHDTLVNAAVEHPMLFDYVEYKKFLKLAQMSEIHAKINPATGRIHGELNQNVDTGRYSSKNPNLQNIPARTKEGERFRELFIASVGNILIIADFSAIELVIIGIKSGDKNLLHALNNNLDLHCWTMSHFLGCPYEALVAVKDYKSALSIKNIEEGIGCSTRDIQHVAEARRSFQKKFKLPELDSATDLVKWVNIFRGYCKTLTYGIAYGLSSFGLSRKFHCEPDTAQQFIDVFFSIYPQIKSWLDLQADLAMDRGYSKTTSGRRRYYRRPQKPTNKDIESALTAFLKEQKRDPDSLSREEEDELWEQMSKRLWREYKQTIGRIRRQAANQPIQGLSADITKLAMVMWEDWWAEFAPAHGISIFKFGIVLTVHDEIVLDVPKKVKDKCKEMLKWAMETAAKKMLGNDANIVVKPIESPFWKK